eukprot:SAG31_NODE_21488_length_548_cov_0.995546_1_plen_151_part_01
MIRRMLLLLVVAAAYVCAASPPPPPKLSLGGLSVTLDWSLPRATSFNFEGHAFSVASTPDADPAPQELLLQHNLALAAVPMALNATCTSTETYCSQLANCFQGCVDNHEAPYCYQSRCCPSRTFGNYNISSLGFYECKSTPCLANCTAVFA